MMMLRHRYQSVTCAFQLVGFVLSVQPVERNIDIVRDAVAPDHGVEWVGDKRNCLLNRTARFGENDLPTDNIVEREVADHASTRVASDINKIVKASVVVREEPSKRLIKNRFSGRDWL